MDADTVAALAAPAGRALIEQAAAALADGSDELAVVTALRRTATPPVASAALTQARMRPAARRKLGPRAGEWLVLPDSLEQATRAEVAAERAAFLFGSGVRSVIDAGAGLGSDTIALARAGITVLAIERDPVVAAALAANVAALGVGSLVDVRCEDATTVIDTAPPEAVLFADPARRAGGRRIFDPEESSPPLSWLVSAYDAGRQVVAKMSPSLSGSQVPAGWGCGWTSTQTEQGRSVVDAMLLSPPLHDPPRRAWVLGDPAYRLGGSQDGDLPTGPLGRFVYEPDGAVNQAELVRQLLDATGGHLLRRGIGYFTADRVVAGLPARCFEVLESMPWSRRRVGAALAAYDASDLVVKMRGLVIDPVPLRKGWLPALAARNGESLTVILIGPREGARALICRPARAASGEN